MRIIPRITGPKLRTLKRYWRALKPHLTVARVALVAEVLICGLVMFFLLTGRRGDFVDGLGKRADFVVLLLTLAVFVLFHRLASHYLFPRLERYFAPAHYDERRILFDLGQEARTATDVDHLYRLIIKTVGAALQTESVAIFVQDDVADAFVCRVSDLPDEDAAVRESSAAPLTLAREAFVIRRLRNLRTPMDVGPQDFELWRRAFQSASAAARETREVEQQVLEQIQARLLLQIMTRDQIVGLLSLGPRKGGHAYSAADKEMLMSVASQLALIIENAKLAERMVAEERLRRELALAAEVQRGLLPSQPPPSASLELAGFCQPARGVGGDYYDFLSLPNGQTGITIADVSGKGISAALVMSNVQASLRSQTMVNTNGKPTPEVLADLVAGMNRLLCHSTSDATYVTFFYAQFDEGTRQLSYVNAGHNPPFLLRLPPAGTVQGRHNCLSLAAGGLAIGLFDQSRYEPETIQMYSGDLLIAYTDGVTEALNPAEEEFGEQRLQDALAAVAHLATDQARDQIVAQIQTWCAGAPQHDDLTFLILKVR